MKTARLVIDYTFDFVVFGLVSSGKEYHLAWYMNKVLGIQLIKSDDIVFEFLKGGNFFISNFKFETEYSTFRLFKNRSAEFRNANKPYLLPEHKEYDYIVTVEGEMMTEAELQYRLIRQIPIVHLATKFQVEELPSRENLLF